MHAAAVSMTGGTDLLDLVSAAVAPAAPPVNSATVVESPTVAGVPQAPPLVGVSPGPTPVTAVVQQVPQPHKVGAKLTNVAGGMCDEKTVEYLRDPIEEKKGIENNNKEENSPKSIVLRLLDQGKIYRAQ